MCPAHTLQRLRTIEALDGELGGGHGGAAVELLFLLFDSFNAALSLPAPS
jgi:hypothetical protein